MDIAVRSLTSHTIIGTHMPYEITQCYLPPGRGDVSSFTPAEAGTGLSDLVGWLHTEMVYLSENGHPSWY